MASWNKIGGVGKFQKKLITREDKIIPYTKVNTNMYDVSQLAIQKIGLFLRDRSIEVKIQLFSKGYKYLANVRSFIPFKKLTC